MDVTTPDVKLTYDDLLRMPDDGLRHELIDGEHSVTPSPAIRELSAFAPANHPASFGATRRP